MKLLIVESPGKVKKIQSFLDGSWKVMASVGHVRDLPQKEIGTLPPHFVPHYLPTVRGREVLSRLKAAAKNASEIYLATDPDREGEAIAWHIEDALQLKDVKRIRYSEITAQAVKDAIAHPSKIDHKLVAAQEGRRVLDRLVGYMVSPALCQQTGERLSAGRVQSPAVRLVVERERAIRNFKVTVHYGVELIFEALEHVSRGWTAAWQPKKGGWIDEYSGEYLLNEEIARKVASVRDVIVTDCKESEKKSAPPAPFITSTLQQAASVSLEMSPKQTMAIAQKLYEDGHITYMRTDSPNLSDEAIDEIRSWAAKNDYPVPAKTRKWKSKAGAQEAHEAIRPTHFDVETAGETKEERQLYQLIRLRAIASQLLDAVFSVRELYLEAEVEGKIAYFEAKGRILKVSGWKALVEEDQTNEDDKHLENLIPVAEAQSILTAQDSKLLTKKTKPPKRYTEAALIKELEKKEIGRPSTYAAILDNITSRNYLKLEKRFLIPTETGEQVVDTLIPHFFFLDYPYTKELEQSLDDIATGEKKYIDVVSGEYKRLEDEIAKFVNETSPQCPECGKALRHLKNDKKNYDFWACSGYPDCSITFSNENNAPGQRTDNKPKTQGSGFDCPKCGKSLIRRKGTSKRGKPYDFFACSGYPGCKQTFDVLDDETPNFEARKYSCPECDKPLIRRKGTSKKGKPYDFFACSGYPGCKQTFDVLDDEAPDFEKNKKEAEGAS